MLECRTIEAYHFGFCNHLSNSQLRLLAAHFQAPNAVEGSVLEGRTAVTRTRLDGVGPVVIKHYRRGGLLRHFITAHYLNIGQNRARREFQMLQLAAASGISVPHAVAYAYCGRLFYRAWLITGEISHPQSLAQISRQDPFKLTDIMPRVRQQISLLIQHRIWHVDLHPGNVVVDQAGNVFLLDFDKSKILSGNKDRLQKRYLIRWRRAVKKHRLSDSLIEMMQVTPEVRNGGR